MFELHANIGDDYAEHEQDNYDMNDLNDYYRLVQNENSLVSLYLDRLGNFEDVIAECYQHGILIFKIMIIIFICVIIKQLIPVFYGYYISKD